MPGDYAIEMAICNRIKFAFIFDSILSTSLRLILPPPAQSPTAVLPVLAASVRAR